MFAPGGTQPMVLRKQLLATYLNLASRRINAATAISLEHCEAPAPGQRPRRRPVRTATLALPVDRQPGR